LDEGGFSAWLTQLNAGFDRTQMVAEFMNSPEFQALCEQRAADSLSVNGMRCVGVGSAAFTLPSFPGLVNSRGERVDAETYPPRATLEQYQDIWVKGKLQKRGVRECADRFELIADFCRQFKRPFTVLDLGANLGYFSLRLTECFDCTSVACEGIYVDWIQEVLVQNANPRVILLKQIFTLADLKALAQVEHFDVVLGLSVIHHLDGAFDESLEVLRSLGDHLILELPFEANACGQQIVQQAVETRGQRLIRIVFCETHGSEQYFGWHLISP
jgi:SAM-dependent methyltransferase